MKIWKLALAAVVVAACSSGAGAVPIEFVVTGVVGQSDANDEANLTGRDYTATYRLDTDDAPISASATRASYATTFEVVLGPLEGAEALMLTGDTLLFFFNRTGLNVSVALDSIITDRELSLGDERFIASPLAFSFVSDDFFSDGEIPTLDSLLSRPELTLTSALEAGIFPSAPPLESVSAEQTLPAAVPVPATLPLLLAGLGGLFFAARRRAA
ncbi:MAG: PEP-CTERM sorting domain-containing protein [Pseudomonadota bacterium]